MITNSGPKVIEYNVRFGDPECQVILRNLKSDLLDILYAVSKDKLKNIKIINYKQHSICVILASKGYPKKYSINYKIQNINKAKKVKNVEIFHSGTKKVNDNFFSNGGRVLSISSVGQTIESARTSAYEALKILSWSKGFFRTDIGKKNIK